MENQARQPEDKSMAIYETILNDEVIKALNSAKKQIYERMGIKYVVIGNYEAQMQLEQNAEKLIRKLNEEIVNRENHIMERFNEPSFFY